MGLQLRDRTVGIHGCGNVGKEVVRLLQPFGVTVLACDRLNYADFYRAHGVTAVTAQELWERSEILTIHLPKNTSTVGMYSAQVLDRLKPGCFLINTARGEIVDEGALAQRPRTAGLRRLLRLFPGAAGEQYPEAAARITQFSGYAAHRRQRP
jgi:D-3-phosphoglycerate dehydrogenase